MAGRYSLDPAMPVLLRPDGTVQVGWDPRRAVTVRPPSGLSAVALAAVLRRMQATAALEDLAREAARHGEIGADDLSLLIQALVGAGVARPHPSPRAGRAPAIRVHGRGPLAEVILDGLTRSGARVKHSSQPHAAVRPEATDLVVLTDYLAVDPRLLRELRETRLPHLQVRVRDGMGLVGPLVLPGLTSCLDCADLHRCDRDAAWPVVAAQLRDTVGSADRATVLATAALALGQINTVLAALRGAPGPRPPATLSTTLEFDATSSTITSRHWPRHPRCAC